MHYFVILRHTQIMTVYKIMTRYFWEFQSDIALWECCLRVLLADTIKVLPNTFMADTTQYLIIRTYKVSNNSRLIT